ncbi:hypothetical protein ACFVH6_09800 [Spirillospora sp. NPDC127200]
MSTTATTSRTRRGRRASGLALRAVIVSGSTAVMAASATAVTAAATVPQAPPQAPVRTAPDAPALKAPALVCDAATTPDRPVTFAPPVGLLPRRTTVTGTAWLGNCSSPDGAHRKIHYGFLSGRATAVASCTKARDIAGEGGITWYDADGNRLGTTTVRPAQQQILSYNPGDALLVGTALSGPLAGKRIRGSATPTSDVSRCAVQGLRTVHGKGKVSFF